MIRQLRRVLLGLVLLGMAAVIVGSVCTPRTPVITLESLQAEVDLLSIELCALYAERGETPTPGSYLDSVCP